MRAEVIAIGDELTSGQRLDTNSQWLSARLGELGVRVTYHTTVGDELDANIDVFRLAMERADLVVVTGGLGPTADDLTRDALAAACDVELTLDEESLRHIEALFARRARPMPERNRVQALFPQGAMAIRNPHGSAPGIYLRRERPHRADLQLFALPGVPAEMKEMWDETVAPRIAASLARPRVLRQHVIKCFGVGESDLEAMLPDLIRRGHRPTVGITVSQATISLRILAEGDDESECTQLIATTRQKIEASLGTLIFGTGEEELEHAVLRLLDERGLTLAVFDAGTQGRIASWLAEAAGELSSAWSGGVVVASEAEWARCEQAEATSRRSLKAHVEARAQEVRQHFQADLGLALGPWPRVPGAEAAGQFYFALATGSDCTTRAVPTAGHPELLRARAAKQALNHLRLWLMEA